MEKWLIAKVPSGKDQTLFEWDQHGWMLWTNKETGLRDDAINHVNAGFFSLYGRFIGFIYCTLSWMISKAIDFLIDSETPKHLFSHEGNMSILKVPKLRYLAKRS